jgi:hypothetical protein
MSYSKSFNLCSSAICRLLATDSLAVEEAMFSFCAVFNDK